MKRKFWALMADDTFDVLVVGGGIYGAWTAYDAALRGLTVAIVDKGDWASGTSSASTKLIHGGLRYLEHLRLDLVRTSLEERKRLATLAPHMVLPLRFFVPVYEENRVGPMMLKTGLWMYDLLAGKHQPVAGHRSVSRRQAMVRYPFLNTEQMTRGFTYGDCQMDDCRFTLDIVKGAVKAGAVAVNYVEAVELLQDRKKVVGATVRDLTTGSKINISAKLVVNAAGPWVPLLGKAHFMSNFIRLSKGVHLVMPPLPVCDALLLMTQDDKRIFFMVPWYGKTLVGTTDADFSDDPDTVAVTREDVEYLLTETNRFLGDQVWKPEDVLGAFAGLRALKNEPGKPPSQVSREWSFVEHSPGLMVSIGGKFTSARADAAQMVNRILELLNRPSLGETPTATVLLPSAPHGDFKSWQNSTKRKSRRLGMDPETTGWSIFRYGTAVEKLHKWIRRDAALAERLVPELPFCRAEVVYSAKKEMVVTLEDLIRRRLPVMILSGPDRSVAEQAAALAAPYLGWSDEDCREQVEKVMTTWQGSASGV
ncbi:MAG: glycerol-3-phosphate dehydrogenase/oxidase [Desulfobacteraceae bacterium]|nr:glycerol-3-phosphate dehydrogenase/oxidase [Desulfobacteraceae bacterium]